MNSRLMKFACNICDGDCEAVLPNRELPTCPACGSSVRFRWLVHAISLGLYGKSMPLNAFPESKHISAIGMSDADQLAEIFRSKFDYRNTYYHTEPRLDITDVDPNEFGKYDFIVSSEVFEHIPLPIQGAFDNLYRLLKPNGFVLFSTPWAPDGHTREHFPNLHNWAVAELAPEDFVLVNRTRDGNIEIFEDLCFHGGPGTVLEFRLFSRADLTSHFQTAGFQEIEFCPEDEYSPYGIIWEPWSRGTVIRKKELA